MPKLAIPKPAITPKLATVPKLAIVASSALALCLGLPAAALAQDAPTVSVQDNVFAPPRVEVVAGNTLTWSLAGAEQHTITADDGSFDSGTINPGDSFAMTFDAAGTYAYYCQIHGAPGGIGMAGTVVVN